MPKKYNPNLLNTASTEEALENLIALLQQACPVTVTDRLLSIFVTSSKNSNFEESQFIFLTTVISAQNKLYQTLGTPSAKTYFTENKELNEHYDKIEAKNTEIIQCLHESSYDSEQHNKLKTELKSLKNEKKPLLTTIRKLQDAQTINRLNNLTFDDAIEHVADQQLTLLKLFCRHAKTTNDLASIKDIFLVGDKLQNFILTFSNVIYYIKNSLNLKDNNLEAKTEKIKLLFFILNWLVTNSISFNFDLSLSSALKDFQSAVDAEIKYLKKTVKSQQSSIGKLFDEIEMIEMTENSKEEIQALSLNEEIQALSLNKEEIKTFTTFLNDYIPVFKKQINAPATLNEAYFLEERNNNNNASQNNAEDSNRLFNDKSPGPSA